jgi:hypothetical protein
MATAQNTNVFNPVLYFPPEVTIQIFQHLKPEELVIASEVSKSWNNFIGSSKLCMARITVDIRCTMNRDVLHKEINSLAYSKRQYQNLVVNVCGFCMSTVTQAVKLHAGKWKSVRIFRSSFNHTSEALDLLECLESSVEKLIMSEVNIDNPYLTGRRRLFQFPNLKVFHAEFMQVNLFNEAFHNVQNLEDFYLNSNSQTVSTLDTIMRMLHANTKLKTLNISNNVFNQIMYHNSVQSFDFKLESFTTDSFFYQSQFTDRVHENFLKMLMKQAETLQHLEFKNWMGVVTTIFAFHLPNLKSLTLMGLERHMEYIPWEYLDFPTNQSLRKLSIDIGKNHEAFKKFTTSAPNLTCFTTSELDYFMLTTLAKSHPNLICLSIGSLDIYKVSDKTMFKKLKHIQFSRYMSRLQKSIKKKVESAKSHLEKKIEGSIGKKNWDH